jgi:hypothetical protein
MEKKEQSPSENRMEPTDVPSLGKFGPIKLASSSLVLGFRRWRG